MSIPQWFSELEASIFDISRKNRVPRHLRKAATPIGKEGFILKSGKKLMYEDAILIANHVGLNTDHSTKFEYEYIEDCTVCKNPVYTPHIDSNEPLPPMLQFLRSDGIPRSEYTINLNTLEPTRNSPIKKAIPEYIRIKLM